MLKKSMLSIKTKLVASAIVLLIAGLMVSMFATAASASPIPFEKWSNDAWDAAHTNGNLVALKAAGGGIYTHYGNNNGVATAINKPFNSDELTDVMDPNVSANAGKITAVIPGIYLLGDLVAFEDPDGAQLWHNNAGVWTQFDGWTVDPDIDRIDNFLASGGSDTCLSAGDRVFCQDENDDPFIEVSNAGIDFGSNEGRPYSFMENNLEYAQGRLIRTTVTDMGDGVYRSSIWSKFGSNDWVDITPNLLVDGDIIYDHSFFSGSTTIFVIYNTELDTVRAIRSTDSLFTGWTQVGGTNLDLGDVSFNPFATIFNDGNSGRYFVSAQDSNGHGRLVIYNPTEDVWEEMTNPDFENDGTEPESVAVTGIMFEGSMRFGTATLGNNDETTNGKIYTGSSVIPSSNTTTTTVATSSTSTSTTTPATTAPGGGGSSGEQPNAPVTPGNPNGHPANTVTPEIEDDAPNGGDGNNDGTPDSEQDNVSSFINPETGTYVTFVAPLVCTNEVTIVEAEPVQNLDGTYEYPAGLLNFTIACQDAGGMSTVKMYYYGTSGTLDQFTPRKFINGDYQTLVGAAIEEETVGGFRAVTLTYSLADGGPLDADGLVNSSITDPAGLGVQQGSLPSTGMSSFALVGYSTLLILIGGAVFSFAYRRKLVRS